MDHSLEHVTKVANVAHRPVAAALQRENRSLVHLGHRVVVKLVPLAVALRRTRPACAPRENLEAKADAVYIIKQSGENAM
jgi:hypothetical protein